MNKGENISTHNSYQENGTHFTQLNDDVMIQIFTLIASTSLSDLSVVSKSIRDIIINNKSYIIREYYKNFTYKSKYTWVLYSNIIDSNTILNKVLGKDIIDNNVEKSYVKYEGKVIMINNKVLPVGNFTIKMVSIVPESDTIELKFVRGHSKNKEGYLYPQLNGDLLIRSTLINNNDILNFPFDEDITLDEFYNDISEEKGNEINQEDYTFNEEKFPIINTLFNKLGKIEYGEWQDDNHNIDQTMIYKRYNYGNQVIKIIISSNPFGISYERKNEINNKLINNFIIYLNNISIASDINFENYKEILYENISNFIVTSDYENEIALRDNEYILEYKVINKIMGKGTNFIAYENKFPIVLENPTIDDIKIIGIYTLNNVEYIPNNQASCQEGVTPTEGSATCRSIRFNVEGKYLLPIYEKGEIIYNGRKVSYSKNYTSNNIYTSFTPESGYASYGGELETTGGNIIPGLRFIPDPGLYQLNLHNILNLKRRNDKLIFEPDISIIYNDKGGITIIDMLTEDGKVKYIFDDNGNQIK